jgi:hypothetical protein
MADYLEPEALNMLINKVTQYRMLLTQNYSKVRNAAAVCDQAMGSDKLSQKMLKELDDCVTQIQLAIDLSTHLLDVLDAEYKESGEIDL